MIDVSLLGDLPAASSAKSPEAQQARVDEMRNRVDRLETKVETLKLGLHQILLDVSDLELCLLDLDDMEKARLKELLEKKQAHEAFLKRNQALLEEYQSVLASHEALLPPSPEEDVLNAVCHALGYLQQKYNSPYGHCSFGYSPAAHIREEAQETYPDLVKNRAFSLSAQNVDRGRKRLRSALPTPTSSSLESSTGSSSIAPLASPANGSKQGKIARVSQVKQARTVSDDEFEDGPPYTMGILSDNEIENKLPVLKGMVHLVLNLITSENTETIERADRIVLELIIKHYPSSFDQSNTAIPLEGDTDDATEGEPEELSEDAVVGDEKAERSHL
ncbi:hypothetical protein BGW41_005059 [Actinomortierella wolfii]|nr:hypothetical protein BGW41_005059 [Actinomortierella wolfii]